MSSLFLDLTYTLSFVADWILHSIDFDNVDCNNFSLDFESSLILSQKMSNNFYLCFYLWFFTSVKVLKNKVLSLQTMINTVVAECDLLMNLEVLNHLSSGSLFKYSGKTCLNSWSLSEEIIKWTVDLRAWQRS